MMIDFMKDYNDAYLVVMEEHPSMTEKVVEIGGGMWDPAVRGALDADQIESYDRLRVLWDAIVWPVYPEEPEAIAPEAPETPVEAG